MFPVQDQLILCTSHCLYIAICTNNSMSCGNALALVHLKILKQSLQNLQISWQTKQECFFYAKNHLGRGMGGRITWRPGFGVSISQQSLCLSRPWPLHHCCLLFVFKPHVHVTKIPFISFDWYRTRFGEVYQHYRFVAYIYIYVCWSIPCANLVALPHKNTVRYSRLNGLLPRR